MPDRYYEMIEKETLPPDMIMDVVPLCMDSVRYMLGSCRVPGLTADTLAIASNSRHVVVVRSFETFYIILIIGSKPTSRPNQKTSCR